VEEAVGDELRHREQGVGAPLGRHLGADEVAHEAADPREAAGIVDGGAQPRRTLPAPFRRRDAVGAQCRSAAD
jgi:hypothetical protein